MSRPIGNAGELERRRRQAVEAVYGGESPEVVATVYGVDRSSMYRWLRLAQQPDGLAAKPHPGPAARLSAKQYRQLESLLLQGARAHGWANELWTCARIATLIERHFGVSFHHDHVGRLLHACLQWSPQKPRRRARERDEKSIKYWQRVIFPRIVKQARERDAHLAFLDESGFMLTPTVRRTWAPRGRGAVLDCWDRRDRLSAISALTVSPRTRRLNLYFQVLPHNVHGEDTVEFLRLLKKQLGGPFTVLWDGGSVHSKCKAVKPYLAKHPEIVAETLPAYAPELNPDELVWGWTKYGRLANLAAKDTDELGEIVIDELVDLSKNKALMTSFFNKTKLPIAA